MMVTHLMDGGFSIMKSTERNRAKRYAAVCIVWLLTAAILLVSAAFVAGKIKISQKQMPVLSVCVLLLATAAASRLLTKNGKGKRALLAAVLLSLVVSSLLLILGFLIYGNEITLKGCAAVLISCMIGALSGLLLSGNHKKRGAGRTLSVGKR